MIAAERRRFDDDEDSLKIEQIRAVTVTTVIMCKSIELRGSQRVTMMAEG